MRLTIPRLSIPQFLRFGAPPAAEPSTETRPALTPLLVGHYGKDDTDLTVIFTREEFRQAQKGSGDMFSGIAEVVFTEQPNIPQVTVTARYFNAFGVHTPGAFLHQKTRNALARRFPSCEFNYWGQALAA